MRKRIFLSFFLILFMLFCIRITGQCDGDTGYFNAVEIQIDNFIDPEVKEGTTYWYYFTAPPATTTDDQWVILRVVAHTEKGNIFYEIMDEHLNVVKGSYATSGDHMSEIVCRLDNTIEGTTGTYMPRLVRGHKYYIRVSGLGKYTIGLNTYKDDYSGEFDTATQLAVGTPLTGNLERDDDIDSFCFKVPSNMAYKITVFASKKMNARITDEYNYTINTNNLRVLRDRGTAEYVVSGNGTIRYFFLYGSGGTNYKISVSIDQSSYNLGLWTKVNSSCGNRYIQVDTYKGAKVTIIVKAGKKNGKLYFKPGKKSKKKSVTQKSVSKKYKLNRKLKVGDVVIVTATKVRFKEFNYRKKIKSYNSND
ncbi:hypothetical protein [Butyrivibrio sp. AE3004]|uniref:hypothetical protein n=1 Tax=Butyrivibrio sp. AE3004 TaxID=1506994 RepID=UPI00049416FF|nr:hypothetical protein [Butyrivibrio sp. AE3004]